MSQSPVMLHFAQDLASAERIAQAAGMASALIDSHRFPDGELKLRLPEHLPEHVVLLRTLDNPNEKLVELLLVARTARTLGARHDSGGPVSCVYATGHCLPQRRSGQPARGGALSGRPV